MNTPPGNREQMHLFATMNLHLFETVNMPPAPLGLFGAFWGSLGLPGAPWGQKLTKNRFENGFWGSLGLLGAPWGSLGLPGVPWASLAAPKSSSKVLQPIHAHTRARSATPPCCNMKGRRTRLRRADVAEMGEGRQGRRGKRTEGCLGGGDRERETERERCIEESILWAGAPGRTGTVCTSMH